MSAAFVLAFVGASSVVDAWAADVVPTKAPASLTYTTAAPGPCTDPADFITTNCQLCVCRKNHPNMSRDGIAQAGG
jgi:hypothetical protein